MGIFQLSGSDGMTSDLHREPVDTCSEPWRFNNLSHPRSNTSLKVGHTHTGFQFIRAEKSDPSSSLGSWPVELPMDQTGDIIHRRLKRLWKPSGKKPVSDNKRQIDCSAAVSRIFSSLCQCVTGWRGARQVDEVLPFGILLINLAPCLHVVALGEQRASRAPRRILMVA